MRNIPLQDPWSGVWRSLVAHLLWEQRVVSSNLTTPTNKIKELAVLWYLTEPALGANQGPEWRWNVPDQQSPQQKSCFIIGPIGELGSERRRHADWVRFAVKGALEPAYVVHL